MGTHFMGPPTLLSLHATCRTANLHGKTEEGKVVHDQSKIDPNFRPVSLEKSKICSSPGQYSAWGWPGIQITQFGTTLQEINPLSTLPTKALTPLHWLI